ncbi:hypothetical protein ABCS02_17480 [Microbacterium sp. X-17]|uniref:hypothetical protein n=1 Tax=Microbacterium sp. X-17 TaxID=3144404 RepID=UPI0031F4C831
MRRALSEVAVHEQLLEPVLDCPLQMVVELACGLLPPAMVQELVWEARSVGLEW